MSPDLKNFRFHQDDQSTEATQVQEGTPAPKEEVPFNAGIFLEELFARLGEEKQALLDEYESFPYVFIKDDVYSKTPIIISKVKKPIKTNGSVEAPIIIVDNVSSFAVNELSAHTAFFYNCDNIKVNQFDVDNAIFIGCNAVTLHNVYGNDLYVQATNIVTTTLTAKRAMLVSDHFHLMREIRRAKHLYSFSPTVYLGKAMPPAASILGNPRHYWYADLDKGNDWVKKYGEIDFGRIEDLMLEHVTGTTDDRLVRSNSGMSFNDFMAPFFPEFFREKSKHTPDKTVTPEEFNNVINLIDKTVIRHFTAEPNEKHTASSHASWDDDD
ncbi:MAG: hypothetical protein LBT59_21320 [Clostridiales bacterium]|jgi:hypothetical protein|nr:hypothetical protein [Clostridiales bacterium]